jgi:hypothetical protein|tara:strand:- start:170 stop:340 length:171 start_codon:yes stop_codon:yes gene_type:complete
MMAREITQREQLARDWREALRQLIALTIKRARLERDRATQRRHSDNALLLMGFMDD